MIFLASFKEVLGDVGSKIFPSWQAVVVQLVATGILLFIAVKFFYKPAKEFIEKRQNYINSQINDANDKFKEADKALKEAQDYRIKNVKETNKLI